MRERNVGVIARVPLDEGSLTGTLTERPAGPPAMAEQLFRGRKPVCHCRTYRAAPAIGSRRYDHG